MKFNVVLDKEQLEEIANITADKVLKTVEYTKGNIEWYEEKIKRLEQDVSKRDSMLVQKDLLIDRLMESLRNARNKTK